MHCREIERLTFLEKRDGRKATIEFAQRGIASYRKAVLKTRTMYSDKMIESYVCFKRYINATNLLEVR